MPRASAFRCTYRLQLTPEFGFREARGVVPYLRELGVSHLYLSPVLEARSGTTHGYDVVDPTRVRAELGGEPELRRLCGAGLGVVLDIVPNHMATGDENRFWPDPKIFDVDLESGWYRRFFDIDDLAGVRIEDPEVFELTHGKVLELLGEGLVDGLRVDHPDGLADPAEYLDRLAARGARHVWAEKILEPGERLRDWPVEGTTGYEFANDVTALFVDPEGEGPLTQLYAELTGEARSFEDVAYEAKLERAIGDFARDFERLRALYTHPGMEAAAAAMPVYRTYVEPRTGCVAEADREAVAGLPDDLRRVLLLEVRGHDEFVTRWQQTTGPVTAKGVEDTAFYRYFRLTALNEVGGDPGRFSLAVEEFHRANLERAALFPRNLLATQTHDTKRSGDVRARIGALAGMAELWGERVRRWRELTGGMDDPNEEYLLWQTLVGAWPIAPERLERYLEKALREGKRNTSWREPNLEHERRAASFVRRLYDNRAFLDDFEPFAARVAEEGRRVSQAQTLLKLTCPGVPDIYQGDEYETLSLVDPDNRRPVDWRPRESPKSALVRRVLALRQEYPDAFDGDYEPLDLGPDRCGFVRGGRIRVEVGLRAGGRHDITVIG
ncbi:MAG TPA: malto-oligosyltrehalose synthase [Gaiellaceae bacterium]